MAAVPGGALRLPWWSRLISRRFTGRPRLLNLQRKITDFMLQESGNLPGGHSQVQMYPQNSHIPGG